MDVVPYFCERVTIRSIWQVFSKIKEILGGHEKGRDWFRSSCFDHFMHLGDNLNKGF